MNGGYNDFLKEIPKDFSKGLLLRAQDHPRSFSIHFLLKINKEIASESSGSSPVHFPYISLSKSIRKLLLRAQDHLPILP